MSEKATPTYDPGLAAAVLEHMASLADALEPAIPVAFEELTAEPGALPRIMLKPSPSDAQERRYVSGEAIRPFPFTSQPTASRSGSTQRTCCSSSRPPGGGPRSRQRAGRSSASAS